MCRAWRFHCNPRGRRRRNELRRTADDVSPERLKHEIGPMLAAAAARIAAEANEVEQSGLGTVSI